MLPLKLMVWLLPGCQPTPETWSPMPLQVVEYWLPAEPTVMQAEPWPLFHICQYMPLVVPFWTPQTAAWAMPGAATMAVAAARAAAPAPRNSRRRLRQRPLPLASGRAGGPFMDGFPPLSWVVIDREGQVTAGDLLDGF